MSSILFHLFTFECLHDTIISKEEFNMTLGERIRHTRKFLGLTQKQLAEATGISRVSISNYEKGTRTPDSETLKRLSYALNTSTDYLLGQKNLPASNPTTLDFAVYSIYENFSVIKNYTDTALELFLEEIGYNISSNIYNFTIDDIGTEKFNNLLSSWKKPENQYYTMTHGKDSFNIPPFALAEFEENIKHAIEFEWYKLRERYKNYQPPTTE